MTEHAPLRRGDRRTHQQDCRLARGRWWQVTTIALFISSIGWIPVDSASTRPVVVAPGSHAGIEQAGPADAMPPIEIASIADRTAPDVSARGERPTVEVTPSPASAPVGPIRTYQVQAGDTLSEIAERFGVDVLTIALANHLSDTDHLSIGQQLTILPVSGVLHVVGEGETIIAIAERYRVIPEEIAAANGLVNSDLIQIGQQLIIPMRPEVLRTLAASPSRPLKPTTYRVAAGDSLNAIAARFGITAETLRWANQIENPDALSIDQELIIPPVDGVLHTVAAGDSIGAIGTRYGVDPAEIVRVNGLTNPDRLQIGQLLVIPGGRPPAPAVQPAAAPMPTPPPAPTQAPQPTASPVAAVAAPTPKPAPPPPPTPAPAPAPPSSANGSQIASIALKYIGRPYVWGGASPSGFDCSGFVMYVARQAGIPMPRDLGGQLGSGRRVSRGELQPGDIVFFANTYMPGLSHNGIYVGDGKFVHAASERTGVIVTDLSSPYWSARFFAATRPGS